MAVRFLTAPIRAGLPLCQMSGSGPVFLPREIGEAPLDEIQFLKHRPLL